MTSRVAADATSVGIRNASFARGDEQRDDAWRLSVAPMMDWTDRHCRFFHRLLTRRARLYTEMVTTGALLHGDVARGV